MNAVNFANARFTFLSIRNVLTLKLFTWLVIMFNSVSEALEHNVRECLIPWKYGKHRLAFPIYYYLAP